MSHHHDHDGSCGCGHDHHPAHGEGCGCGHSHEPPQPYDIFDDGALNESAAGLMQLLQTHKFLPCARFLVKSSREPGFANAALAPVFITDGQESISFLRRIGELLLGLEQHGYISIDYDIPLEGFDYSYFRESQAFRYFESTVSEAAQNPEFLGDMAELECGSIAPAER